MQSRLGGAAAAFLLIAGSAVALAAEDDAMTGRINHGSAEVAKPPPSTSGSMPNSIDDPARNDPAASKSSAANTGAATEGPQNAGIIGTAPANAPPGSSPQTVPSTLSPQNAAEDRRSWMERALQLTDEEKQALRSSILRAPDAGAAATSDARIAQAKVGAILPSSVTMRDLPSEVAERLPQARGFKYVRAGDRLLIVQPESWTVVGVLQ